MSTNTIRKTIPRPQPVDLGMPERIYGRAEAALRIDPLGHIVTARTIRRADEAGELPGITIAGHRCYTESALQAWITSRTSQRLVAVS